MTFGGVKQDAVQCLRTRTYPVPQIGNTDSRPINLVELNYCKNKRDYCKWRLLLTKMAEKNVGKANEELVFLAKVIKEGKRSQRRQGSILDLPDDILAQVKFYLPVHSHTMQCTMGWTQSGKMLYFYTL